MIDRWKAAIGDEDAKSRLDLYERAAAHQTTGDNPGIIPQPLLEPILNYVDVARPIVGSLGPKPLPGLGLRLQGHPAHPGRQADRREDRAGVAEDDSSPRRPSTPTRSAAT